MGPWWSMPFVDLDSRGRACARRTDRSGLSLDRSPTPDSGCPSRDTAQIRWRRRRHAMSTRRSGALEVGRARSEGPDRIACRYRSETIAKAMPVRRLGPLVMRWGPTRSACRQLSVSVPARVLLPLGGTRPGELHNRCCKPALRDYRLPPVRARTFWKQVRNLDCSDLTRESQLHARFESGGEGGR
jgi:hypothetical protein